MGSPEIGSNSPIAFGTRDDVIDLERIIRTSEITAKPTRLLLAQHLLGCHGLNKQGGACRAPVVWNRNEFGIKTTPTMYCLRHSGTDEEWLERAAKGGRQKAAEDAVKRRIVPPARAREILRIIVNCVNETWSLRIAMEHLAPFCTTDDHDRALLLAELERLRTLSERVEADRIEAQTERIVRLTEGSVF